MADNKLSAKVTIDTKQAEGALGGLNKSVAGTAAVLNKLKPSAASGGAALTSLSRIAQDAPFGFIAIQNNVTEAVASFNQLKQSTGSTGAALKALSASLIGPGGILLAFSLITSAVTAVVQKYGSLGQAYDALTGKVKVLTKEEQDRAKAVHDSQVDVEKQKVSLEALVKVAAGDVGTKKQQVAALEELNKLIPDYIGVLTQANIKTAEGAKIIQAYTTALINQAEAELLAQRAAELRVKLRERDKTLGAELTRELQKAAAAQQQLAAGGSVAGALSGVNAVTKAVTVNRDAVIKGSDAYKSYIKDYKELADITNRVATLTAGSIELKKDDPKKLKEKVKQFVDKWSFNIEATEAEATPNIVVVPKMIIPDPGRIKRDFTKLIDTNFALNGFPLHINLVPIATEVQEGLLDINKMVKTTIDTSAALQSFTFRPKVIIKPDFDDKELRRLIKELNNIVGAGITNAFTAIGEGIGNAISGTTNAISALAQGFLSAFGGLISSIGKALLEYGIVKTGLDKIIAGGIAIPGAVAIAAGVAAIAIGQLIKTAIPKFATGGIVTGPTIGMLGEAGQPEVVLPLSKLNTLFDGMNSGGGQLTAVVSGDSLRFILNRADRRAGRLY